MYKLYLKLRKLFGLHYYNEDGSPNCCVCCGSKDFIDKVEDYMQYTPCEISYTCKKCGFPVAYWAYGYYDNFWSVEFTV